MSLCDLFDKLPDPRAANAHHKLGDLLVIMIAGAMCGQTTATDIALFADLRRDALGKLVSYDRAPSHDTISRLLRLLDPTAFAELFRQFAARFAAACTEPGPGHGHIALDGKALRRACDAAARTTPPLTVSAFASEIGLCLAALPGPREGQADEGALAIEVVKLLDLAGKTVTGDALHCNRAMAAALTERGAGYVLGLKRNRAAWHAEAEALFAASPVPVLTREQTGHGRTERREAAVVAAPAPRAPGHAAYGKITARRDRAAPKTRYFLLSEAFTPERFLALAQSHWRIETGLHWTLDVLLGEDQVRGRRDHSPANIALLKRTARNLLQLADKPNVPISQRITKCTFSNDYLINAMAHMR